MYISHATSISIDMVSKYLHSFYISQHNINLMIERKHAHFATCTLSPRHSETVCALIRGILTVNVTFEPSVAKTSVKKVVRYPLFITLIRV